MKRTISLWIGMLALAALPVIAQTPAPANVASEGKIHGHVTNPTGAPQSGGTVSLNLGQKEVASFEVNASGDYTGSAAPGTYTLIYRSPGMGKDKEADKFDNIKIVVGQDDVLREIAVAVVKHLVGHPAPNILRERVRRIGPERTSSRHTRVTRNRLSGRR